jgi:hypothetical protein
MVKHSCGPVCVVFQQPAQSFMALNQVAMLLCEATRWKQQDIALALMIPLVMIMVHILVQHMPQGASPHRMIRDSASSLIDRTHRSA